tara:strand:- start:2404 stop:3882 length:1479 start_codon:yes stop_codon:yes gene_type:complete
VAKQQTLDTDRPAAFRALHKSQRNTARERIAAIVDRESIVEYGGLAGETTNVVDSAPADGLITVIGDFKGNPIAIASYDETILDGTMSDRNVRKLNKLIYLAIEHRWPLICFANGEGSRKGGQYQAPPIMAQTRGRYDLYDGLAQMSGWAPTITIVSGRARDSHVGIAVLSDIVITTKDSIFAATGTPGSERTGEELSKLGEVDYLAQNEDAAISAVRELLDIFFETPSNAVESSKHSELHNIIPENRRRPYDMRQVISAFSDENSVIELGEKWGRSMLTVFARINSHSVGIFANQPKSPLAGAIDSAAADKASRFIEMCDAYGLPLISFIDNPGYMVGPQSEREGIARHHARPLTALHHRSVALFSVQIRKAYGLGPFAMSGWGSAHRVPELRLAWPSVESGGMSLEGAAYLVKRKEILAAKTKEEARAIRDEYAEKSRDSGSGLRAARSLQFDDVIEPTATRQLISSMLDRSPRAKPSASEAKKKWIDPR